MIRVRLFSVFVLFALVIAVGCGKKPESAPPTTPEFSVVPESKPAPAPSPEEVEKPAKVEASFNLRKIGFAMHNFEAGTMRLPAGIVGPKGDIGLSWRVQILPYLDKSSADLYQEFKTNEAWDSEHNKKLLAKMPKVFASPGKAAPEGKTYLRSFAGESAIIPMPPSPKGAKSQPPYPNVQPGFLAPGRPLAYISDGTSNTLMVVEAAEPVEWTKPDELPYPGLPGAPNPPPLPKLGGVFAGGFHGLMADGAVHFFPSTLSETNLRAMITTSGGEVLDKDVHDIFYPPKPKKPAPPTTVSDSLPDAAARKAAVANYQDILKAAHHYHDVNGYLPVGIVANKAVGLSWRVQILPHIGQETLYKEFILTEPWDSDHNKPLVEKMPKVFESPGKPAAKGHTFVRTTQGSGGIISTTFDGKPQLRPGVPAGSPVRGRTLSNIQDGLSNTILFVEAAEAVPWTKPDELSVIVTGRVKSYDSNELQLATLRRPPLGGVFGDGFHAMMADGRITFYKFEYPPAEVAKLFSPDDGLPVNPLGEPDKILYSIPFPKPTPVGKPPTKTVDYDKK